MYWNIASNPSLFEIYAETLWTRILAQILLEIFALQLNGQQPLLSNCTAVWALQKPPFKTTSCHVYLRYLYPAFYIYLLTDVSQSG